MAATPDDERASWRRIRLARTAPVLLLAGCTADAIAQIPASPIVLDPVVVTATRRAENSFDIGASVDVIEGATIRDGQPGINLSETLARVPGLFAGNRGNFAQDLQISSRGFGARATFGVRGVRLYQDFIPATMPDGQGQTGSFSLLSAQRIEVLRGPFSTLYGNASGGVIAVFTEDAPLDPVASLTASFGSYQTSNVGLKAMGTVGNMGYVIAGNRLDTEGYREHSAATRGVVNAKLTIAPAHATRITVIGNTQNQPDSQDPLGLTQAQWESDPRQADPLALLFDTRKTVNQAQGGVAVDHVFSPALSARVTTYGGRREVEQFLAFTGAGVSSSGGVVNLDRDYGGFGVRFIYTSALVDKPLVITTGVDVDAMRETRRGYVNEFGERGALRRDEDDTVRGDNFYLEAQWRTLPALSLTAGLRTTQVKYEVDDRYITAANPDDSGSRRYSNTSPIVGVVWHATDTANVYASYGQGFETPTFAELAYRPGGTGPNLALEPAVAKSVEVGVKWRPAARQALNLAVFATDTEDEIVVDSATGGRTTYRNAGETERRGAEIEWTGDLGNGLTAHANYSYLDATYAQAFASGSPPSIVPAGNRLPGAPQHQAFGVLEWTSANSAMNAALEWQYVGRIYANDRNTEFAPAYAIGNARVGFVQTWGRAKFAEFVRVNNFTNRSYVGSVIVGDTNGRYFEPAASRNWIVGVTADIAF